jgi:hypothetical protein
MLVAQVGASFAIWILSGWLLARRAARRRPALSKYSRKGRVALGPALLIWAVAALPVGAGLVGKVQGINDGVLTFWGWLIVAITGLFFVLAQTLAALVMVSIATENESPGSLEPSDGRINDRNTP